MYKNQNFKILRGQGYFQSLVYVKVVGTITYKSIKIHVKYFLMKLFGGYSPLCPLPSAPACNNECTCVRRTKFLRKEETCKSPHHKDLSYVVRMKKWRLSQSQVYSIFPKEKDRSSDMASPAMRG